MAIQDAATALDTEWETDAATVGGMVTEALGHLPTQGEIVDIGTFEFEIDDVAERAVESVLVRRLTTRETHGS
jgi:CBS domain containing-hemolysin-like protein